MVADPLDLSKAQAQFNESPVSVRDPLAVNRQLAAVRASLIRHGAPQDYEINDPNGGLVREPRIEEMGIAIRTLMFTLQAIAEKIGVKVDNNVESYRLAGESVLKYIDKTRDREYGWQFAFEQLLRASKELPR